MPFLQLPPSIARFREATMADAPFIQALVRDTVTEYGFTYEPEGRDRDLQDLATFYPAPDNGFWVVEIEEDDEHRPVGSFALARHAEDTAELRRFYLLPDCRGLGLGRRMLEAVCQFAEERGYRRICLETHSNLAEAIQLYLKNGFTPIPCYTGYPPDYSDTALEKQLG